MKIDEIKQYPIGKKGLKMLTSKHQFSYGKTEILTVRGINEEDKGELNIEFLYNEDLIFSNHLTPLKPILFHLSSLIQEIEVYGEIFIPVEKIYNIKLKRLINKKRVFNPLTWKYENLVKLFSWYIDVFGLIEKGEAISVFDLHENPYKL